MHASKQFRNTLKANFPKIAEAYGDDFDQLSAADSANVFKVAETKAKIDENQAKFQQMSDDRKAKSDAKATDDQNKATPFTIKT